MRGLFGSGDEQEIGREDETTAGEELPREALICVADSGETGEPAGQEQRPCGGEDGFRRVDEPGLRGGHARLDNEHRKDDFFCNIVTEYAAPLFFTGKCETLLGQLLDARVDKEEDRLMLTVPDDAERARQLAEKREAWRGAIEAGEPTPFLLAAIRGPVSVNPVGVYDGLLGFGNFAMDAPQSAWASCNLGEFIFPQSRLSLLPLLLVTGGLSLIVWRRSRRRDASV